MKRNILPAALIILTTACSTPLSIQIPQGRFDLPENAGKGITTLAVSAVSPRYEMTLSPDIALVAVDPSNPTLKAGNSINMADQFGQFFGLSLDAGYGLVDRFEIGFSGSRGSGVYLKTQIIGQPRSRAKKGNLSLALNIAGILHNQGKSKGGATYIYDSSGKDLSLIFGYRMRDDLLLYTSAFEVDTNYSGSVTGGAVPGAYSGKHKQTGYTLGIHWAMSQKSFFDLEYSQTRLVAGLSKANKGFTGFRVGIKLGGE